MPTGKIRLVKDMTPEERAEHEKMLAMLSPRVIAREAHREFLMEEGEDPSIADQCYEGDNG